MSDLTPEQEEQLARLAALGEHNFRQLRQCFRCRRPVVPENAFRRAYDLSAGPTLAVLCAQCDASIPAGSPAEDELRAAVERFQTS